MFWDSLGHFSVEFAVYHGGDRAVYGAWENSPVLLPACSHLNEPMSSLAALLVIC